MCDAGLGGSGRHVEAHLEFRLDAARSSPRLHREHATGAIEGVAQRVGVEHVADEDLGAERREGVKRGVGGIADEEADGRAVREEVAGGRAALPTGGTENDDGGDERGHGGLLTVEVAYRERIPETAEQDVPGALPPLTSRQRPVRRPGAAGHRGWSPSPVALRRTASKGDELPCQKSSIWACEIR